jgi:hypothetical protein
LNWQTCPRFIWLRFFQPWPPSCERKAQRFQVRNSQSPKFFRATNFGIISYTYLNLKELIISS